MQKKIFLMSIILLLAYQSFSQNKRAADRYYSKAQALLRGRDLEGAKGYLIKTIEYDSTKFSAYVILGDIYLEAKNYVDARKNYKKAYSINPKFYLNYKLATALYKKEEYEEAKDNYIEYLKLAPKTSKGVRVAEKRVKNCYFAMKSMKESKKINILNIGDSINTHRQEYNPVISTDGTTLIYTTIVEKNGRQDEDFFISYLENGKWTKGVPLPGYINTVENEGANCISVDGKYLYFTSCDRRGGFGSCDIYVSMNNDGIWSQPLNLGSNINGRSWEAHPTISPDGKTLVFSSTRIGGKGGRDLWMSKLKNKKWGKPKNISELNTAGNEVTPFLHVDGKTMYFSSDGYVGMGDVDFFVSYYNDTIGKWGTPINLGYNINTVGEEYSLMVSRDGKTAYFSTDALDGFGGLDIYTFELNENVRATNTIYLEGEIVDNVSKQKIRKASVSIVDLKDADTPMLVNIDEGSFSSLLKTGSVYAAVAKAPGYMLSSKTFEFVDSIKNYLQQDFILERVAKGRSMSFNNINFDSNKYKILEESLFELNILVKYLKNNVSLNIDIIGHTDSIGTLKDNEILSEKRALAVRKYLQDNGIEPERMNSYGKGEVQPIAKNDTEKGRKENRRTEILLR